MKDRIRRDNALRAAEQYAPTPKSSGLTYGIIGVILAGVCLYFFGMFYGIDLSGRPGVVIAALAAAIIGGAALRWQRGRRSKAAFQAEYQRRSEP